MKARSYISLVIKSLGMISDLLSVIKLYRTENIFLVITDRKREKLSMPASRLVDSQAYTST